MTGLSIALVAVVMVFGTGMIAVVTEHFQKMAKIRANGADKHSEEVMGAIAALREEVSRLRDTTTQYDMAFDAALQRLDSRVKHLEQSAEQSQTVNG